MSALTILQGKLHEFSTAIKLKVDSKLGRTETAADSAKLAGKTLAQIGANALGNPNETPFIAQANSGLNFAPAQLLTKIRMASTDAELTAMKGSTQSMADVFNKWKRTSHNNTGVYPAVPSEMESWTYDGATDRVTMTMNTGSMCGLISPYEFSEYVFDMIVKSNSADDDSIGMVLAFKTVGGAETTLVCGVTTGGYTWDSYSTTALPSMYIVVNLNQGVGRGLSLIFQKELGLPRSGFNGGAAVAGGIRITAKRLPNDTMEVEVRKPDGTYWPAGEIKWTGAIPDPFKGKAAFGYYSLSQPNTTYDNLIIPTPKTDIIDTRNQDLHRWNNTTQTWSVVGKSGAVLPRGRIYKNTETPYWSYFLDMDGSWLTLGGGGGGS
jgi:hypothetical protein